MHCQNMNVITYYVICYKLGSWIFLVHVEVFTVVFICCVLAASMLIRAHCT